MEVLVESGSIAFLERMAMNNAHRGNSSNRRRAARRDSVDLYPRSPLTEGLRADCHPPASREPDSPELRNRAGLPFERAEFRQSAKVPSIDCYHSDPRAARAGGDQGVIGQARAADLLVTIF